MTYEIEISLDADADADAAYEWIAQDSLKYANRWYRGLFDVIETLSENPARCPMALDGNALGDDVRELLYGKRGGVYRILFAIKGETVHVLRVLHGARKYLGEE